MHVPSDFTRSNADAIALFFDYQERLVRFIASQPITPTAAELLRNMLTTGENVLTIYLKINDLLMQHVSQQTQVLPATTEEDTPVNVKISDLQSWLQTQVGQLLGLDAELILPDADWESDLGLDSIRLATMWRQLCLSYPQYRSRHDAIYNTHNIAQLVSYLEGAVVQGQSLLAEAENTMPASDWLIHTLAAMTGVPVALITPDTLLESELGMDSLRLVELQLQFERQFPAVKKGKERLLHFSTVRELVAHLPVTDQTPEQQGVAEEGISPLPVRSDYDIVKEEPVSRMLVVPGMRAVAYTAGPLAASVLLVGERKTVRRWKQHLGKELSVKTIITCKKAWHYNGKVYTVSDTSDMHAWLKEIQLSDFSLIIFLAAPGRRAKAKMSTAAVRLLHLAKLLDKAGLTETGALNLTVVTEGKGVLPQAGARGVARTLSKEWLHSRVRTVHLSARITQWPAGTLARLLQHAPVAHDLVLRDDGLYGAVCTPLSTMADGGDTDRFAGVISKDHVILLLGGAGGITATLTRALSATYGCHFVCVGRTPAPAADPLPGKDAETLTLQDMMEELGAGTDVQALQRRLKLLRRQQRIFETQQAVVANGAKFHYLQGDTAKAADVQAILAYCRRLGPLAGVVHGSGFVRDAIVSRKQVADFRAVFHAKVSTARHLYKLLSQEPSLQFVFFMSSIASIYGNPGQADYVAANDWLNELAIQWNKEAAYTVRSLLWGIWSEAGFVRDQQGGIRMLTEHGVQGISNAAGVAAFMRELYDGNKAAVNVLLSTPSCQQFLAASSASSLEGH